MDLSLSVIIIFSIVVGFALGWLVINFISNRNLDAIRLQFDLLNRQLKIDSEQVLKERVNQLTVGNGRELTSILEPLRENIKEMRTALDSSRDLNNRTSAQLNEAIADVLRHVDVVGREANKLSSALRNDNKITGNWGETVLNELLESQGLKNGVHFTAQNALLDENGQRLKSDLTEKTLIPDVVVHFTDNRDLIIDAKTSLNAFLDYNAANAEDERRDALKRHLRSIREHVKELARKDYCKYIKHPRRSVDFVIMFVPIEAALRLALDSDPKLWREALDMGVFISGEQSLSAALRVLHLSWRQEQQAINQRKVVEEAESMLERVGQFYKLFTEIGAKIESLNNTYTETAKKLKTGRQSILGPAQRLCDLGYKSNSRYPIPQNETDNEE